jgi:hypothetical protein
VKKMKKVLIIVLGLSLLMLSTILAPIAMAATPKKIPVVVTRASNSWTLGTDVWMGGENTWHSRNSIVGGNAYTITSVSEGLYLSGSNRGVVDQNLEIQGLFHGVTPIGHGNSRIDSTITISDSTGKSGTFEGVLHYSGEMLIYPSGFLKGFLAPYNAVSHGIWHGTGDFQGWTYSANEEYINGVSQGIAAYVLIP